MGASRVTLPSGVGAVTGRIHLLLSSAPTPKPRLQRIGWGSTQPVFGIDVQRLYRWMTEPTGVAA